MSTDNPPVAPPTPADVVSAVEVDVASDAVSGADWITAAMDAHAEALVRYTARLTPDLDTARDVVQDAFLRLCRADRAAVGDRVDLWLFTVCRNRAFDLYRKDRRMTPLTEVAARSRAAADDGPEAAALQLDAHGRLLALVATLSDRQQDVLRLKFQHELSYAEIAQVTGLSVSNVGYLLHVALKRLRELAAGLDADAQPASSTGRPTPAAGTANGA